MFKPLDFAEDYIFVWEDGQRREVSKTHSMDPADPGNWSSGRLREGVLIGSNHGVTAQALAKYRKVSVNSITREVMGQLEIKEAAQIALEDYFFAVNLDKLPWDAVVASVMDFGWGAGTKTAIKALQKMVGVEPDGSIGPATISAYDKFRLGQTLESAAHKWADRRIAYYKSLNQAKYGKYLKGWTNRTNYFLPNTLWWRKFYS